jgi:hypothetical protein
LDCPVAVGCRRLTGVVEAAALTASEPRRSPGPAYTCRTGGPEGRPAPGSP